MMMSFPIQSQRRVRIPCEMSFELVPKGLSGRPLEPFGHSFGSSLSSNDGFQRALRSPSGLLRRPLTSEWFFIEGFRRGLSGRPLHPFGCIPYKGNGCCKGKIFTLHKRPTSSEGAPKGSRGRSESPLEQAQTIRSCNT